MDLDDFMAALDDEEPNVSSDYHPDRFDRRQNNRALNKLATGSYEKALDEIHHQSVDRIPRRVATQRPDPDERRHFEAVYGRLGLRIIEATGETDDVTPLIRGRYDIALNEIKVSQPSTRARSSATRARPSLESVNHANAGTRSG